MPDHVLKLKPISLVVEIKCVQSYYITECADTVTNIDVFNKFICRCKYLLSFDLLLANSGVCELIAISSTDEYTFQ